MNKLDVVLLLSESVDVVLSSLLDSDSATAERKRKHVVIKWVNSLITKCLGQCHRTFPVGSLLTNICLLTSPISNISLTTSFGETVQPTVDLSFWMDSSNSSWYLNVFESLCEHFLSAEKLSPTAAAVRKKESLDGSHMTVERISYFPAEERLEALVNGISFNTVPNDFCSLGYSAIIEEFDTKISKGNFFKRCLLLIKTWTLHEASSHALFHGSEDDFLVSLNALKIIQDEKVIEIMTMWFFNSKVVTEKSLSGILQGLCGGSPSESLQDGGREKLANPLLVLLLFLDHFSRFEWTKWAIGVNGLIPLPSCISPLSTESRDGDPFADSKLGQTTGPLGALGNCDEHLSSIVSEQRAILKMNKRPLSAAAAAPILSPLLSPSFSEKSKSKVESNSACCASEEVAGGSASTAGPPPLEPDALPSNFLTNDICIIHPLTGMNLCTAHTATVQTGLLSANEHVFTKQTALKEIFSLGVNKLVSVIHSSITSNAAQGAASEQPEGATAIDTGCKSKVAHATAEQCFPSLFRSVRSKSTPLSKPAAVTVTTASYQTGSNTVDPTCLCTVLRDNIPPTPYTQDITVLRLDPPTPYSEKEVFNELSPFEMSKAEGSYESSTAHAAAGSAGSRTPLGAWGGEPALTPKGPAESGTQYAKKSSDTSRGSNSPTVHSAEHGYLDRANLQALKFENKLDYFSERALETYLENGIARNSALALQAGMGYKGDSSPFSRGSPPVFITKTGTLSTKIPSHSIQPYQKKEEQLWVPGKFSSESSHSPVVTLTPASREGSINSSSSASNVASTFMSQNTSKESSFSMSSRRGTIAGRGMSNGSLAADAYLDRNSPIPVIGAMSLGPGLLTGKTAIVHSRSLDGSASDASGSYSFLSGQSMDNIDSQLDSGEYNTNSERHRANQLALAGRHQQIQRQKSATSQALYVGRMSSGGSGDDQFYLSPSTSGQRSPALSSLLQQRLGATSQSQSSPHLSPHTPPHNLSHPATLHLSQQQGSLSPSYSHLHPSSIAGPDLEIVKQNYKAGFEAQLPSFLRDL